MAYSAESYGDAMAKVYDQVQDSDDHDGAVRFLTGLCPPGAAVLELGVGTGRIACQLALNGVRVTGIDASSEMLKVAKSQPGGELVSFERADMSTYEPHGQFDAILFAFGTFNFVPSLDDQVTCLATLGRHLAAEGHLVIEGPVPDFAAFTRNQHIRTAYIGEDTAMLTMVRHDPSRQTTDGTHILFREPDFVRLLPVRLRYVYPSELELMARIVGLETVATYSDWARSPFVASSTRYVRVLKRAYSSSAAHGVTA